jgi:glucose-6-phosphate 1-dehydrogenase
VFYLSTPSSFFPVIVTGLTAAKLNKPGTLVRVVIEKPFGHDLASARELADTVHKGFRESQVYRIDHYLGKETVRNLLVFRFGNGIFEPLWNRRYVDHIQITVAESIGVEERGAFYEETGAARDVLQNHLLQLLSLVAMEPPATFAADALRDEKLKVLRAIAPPTRQEVARDVVRGQYEAGWVAGVPVKGYRQEDDVDRESETETFVAARFEVDDWRWSGVPFYLRTGKRMGKRVSEIAVVFKRAPHLPFSHNDTEELGSNMLVIRVQPDEGVTIRFGSKVPGPAMEVRDVSMDFSYGQSFTEASPEAYERLILDVLLGEPSLFPQDEEVELSWKILDPIEKHWGRSSAKLEQYLSGSWGPESADAMMARDGRKWRRP